MTATVLLAGTIRTDWTGNRTEIDNAGMRLFNTAGDQTINLNGTSNLISGTIKTALTGKRWELQPDTTMRYYPKPISNAWPRTQAKNNATQTSTTSMTNHPSCWCPVTTS